MRKLLLVGNPNVGKTTLFNSITRSNEHTGNFHGVTVDTKSKVVPHKEQQIEIVDLPGIYSLNTFSLEESISKTEILKSNFNVVLADAFSLRKNLYLCAQLSELCIPFSLVINNFDKFKKHNFNFDTQKAEQEFNFSCTAINAKKATLDQILNLKTTKLDCSYLTKFISKVQAKFNIETSKILLAFNGETEGLNEDEIDYIKSLNPDLVKARYAEIDKILSACETKAENFVYGTSKLDKFLLNPFVSLVGFACCFLFSIYFIFFFAGAWFSDALSACFEKFVISPTMNSLAMLIDNVWLLEFVEYGVFGSVSTVLSFVPQVCLLFVLLTVLEDSGIIARLCYSLDDFLVKLGLNGKAVYTLLLGFGCNTMSTVASRNLPNKGIKTKTAVINPYISCMARLPVYVLIASAFFGKMSFFVVAGLYLLGIVVGVLVAIFLNGVNKSTENQLLLEFPPLQHIDFSHALKVAVQNILDFTKRVFSVVLVAGIVVFVSTHTKFNLSYTKDVTESMIYIVMNSISFLFAPIGLNNAGVLTALFVGVLAKELIVSTISICNNQTENLGLMQSLLLSTSVVNFSSASALSFLTFVLLYCPCLSNIEVLKQETDKTTMLLAVFSQFVIAYLISFVVFNMAKHGLVQGILTAGVVGLIVFAFAKIFIISKRKNKCGKCGKCGKF